MKDRDENLFQSEVGDVRPIGRHDRIIRRPAPADPAALARRISATEAGRRGDPNPLTLPESVPAVDPHDLVGRKKDGVQEGVYRKLRLGKYEVQASIDLHRLLVREAREQVYRFLVSSHQSGLRTVLITHGKGLHSESPGRLKSHVIHWLDESPLVLAYHSARPANGGAGATYALLRKSPENKQRNREMFGEAARHRHDPGRD